MNPAWKQNLPVFLLMIAMVCGAVVYLGLSSTRMGERTSSQETVDPIEHVNANTFQEKVLLSKTPVLVDFYAEWCPPCKMLAPVLAEVAQETTDAKIVKVNVDENRGLAAKYEISSIPTLLVFRDGQPTNRHLGLIEKTAIKRLLSE